MKLLRFWQTLQFKIIITMCVLFLFSSTALVIFNFRLYREELIKTLSLSAANLNKSIVSSLEMAMLSGKREQIQHNIEKIGQDKHISGLFITDKKGSICASTSYQQIDTSLDIMEPSCQICHAFQNQSQQLSVIHTIPDGTRILRTVNPIYNEPACYGCHNPDIKINGVLFLDYSLASYDRQLAAYRNRIIVLGGLTILVVISLTIIFLNKLVINRLKKIIDRLQSIGAGDFKNSLGYKNHDEFAILADNINQMSNQIHDFIKKISQQRDYLQSVINNVQDGLIVVDKDLNVVLVNQVFLKFAGKKIEDVIGLPCYKTWGDDICKNLASQQKCPSKIAIKDGTFAHTTYKHNKEKILEISASPLFGDDGSIIQSIEIIRDITDKERLKNELQQSEKMALMGRLSAGVAHEINNPLATISTCTEGLLNRINESVGKVIKKESWLIEYLKRIDKCVYRCKNIIEKLLIFAHSSKSVKSVIDLNVVIEDTIAMLSHRCKQEQKSITTSFSVLPVCIKGEPVQLSQMILNILVNSLDAMENEGEVNISTYAKNDDIQLVISDTGVGIDKEDLEHIFEPFYTTKEVGKGTGLGLSICQRIIAEHDGLISVESIKGKGCKFEISFPKAQ